MFESLLERVLQRALGDYIEGLDRKNLKLGVSLRSSLHSGLERQHQLGECSGEEIDLSEAQAPSDSATWANLEASNNRPLA